MTSLKALNASSSDGAGFWTLAVSLTGKSRQGGLGLKFGGRLLWDAQHEADRIVEALEVFACRPAFNRLAIEQEVRKALAMAAAFVELAADIQEREFRQLHHEAGAKNAERFPICRDLGDILADIPVAPIDRGVLADNDRHDRFVLVRAFGNADFL